MQAVAPHKVPVRAPVHKMHVADVASQRFKPLLHRLAGHTHGGEVQRGLDIGVVNGFQKPGQLRQLDNHARFFRPHGLYRQRHAAIGRNGRQLAQHLHGALEHALGVFVPIAAAAVCEHHFGAHFACGPDAVRIIAQRTLAGIFVMRTNQVIVHGAFRGEHTNVQAVRLHFLFQLRGALVAVVVQKKMGSATPHLNGFEPQLLLAVQKIIEGMVHVMNSHSGKLFPP